MDNPYKAHKRYPKMNVYDAIEVYRPRNKQIGLRVTEQDLQMLSEIAEEYGATITEISYILLRKKVIEHAFVSNAPSGLNSYQRYQKEPITADLRWRVFERDDFRCKVCGGRRNLQVDHIHPESRGGKSTMRNLQTLCRNCNTKKGSRT